MTELRRGDTFYIQVSGVPEISADFSEIKSILKRKRPDYSEDRSYMFIELGFLDDRSVHETTRLRYDLYHAVAMQKPDLFTETEIKYLDDYVFRRLRNDRSNELAADEMEQWRYQFSSETLSKVSTYISETASNAYNKEGRIWNYGGGAIKAWLDGKILHPTRGTRKLDDLVGTMWIANSLNSDAFERRAIDIASTVEKAQQYPQVKDESPYFRLIDGHKTVTSMVRGLIEDLVKTPQNDGNRMKDGSNIRIHANLPEWAKAVMEEIAPRIEHGIVEVQLYSTDIVEVAPYITSTKQTPRAKGQSHSIVLVGNDDTQRDEAYASIGVVEMPAKRGNRLQRDLEGSIEILGNIYEAAVPLFVEGISLSGNMATVMPNIPGNITVFNGHNEAKTIINLDRLRFLSPVENYSASTMLQTYKKWDEMHSKARRDRNYRRGLVTQYRRGDVGGQPLFDRFIPIYNESPLLREMFDEKQFLRIISSGARIADTSILQSVTNSPPATLDQLQRQFNDRILEILSRLENIVIDKIEELKESDQNIPPDLTMFRTIGRSMSPSFRTHGDNYLRERQLFADLLERYGINPHRIITLYDDTVSKVSDLTAKRISDVSDGRSTTFAFVDPITGKMTVTHL
ncbi:MAG: hypothetical protein IH934_01850 [Nanoarchaeota archaeon]|nr:hypothetical protein [Nanoarchaeota archaeon]